MDVERVILTLRTQTVEERDRGISELDVSGITNELREALMLYRNGQVEDLCRAADCRALLIAKYGESAADAARVCISCLEVPSIDMDQFIGQCVSIINVEAEILSEIFTDGWRSGWVRCSILDHVLTKILETVAAQEDNLIAAATGMLFDERRDFGGLLVVSEMLCQLRNRNDRLIPILGESVGTPQDWRELVGFRVLIVAVTKLLHTCSEGSPMDFSNTIHQMLRRLGQVDASGPAAPLLQAIYDFCRGPHISTVGDISDLEKALSTRAVMLRGDAAVAVVRAIRPHQRAALGVSGALLARFWHALVLRMEGQSNGEEEDIAYTLSVVTGAVEVSGDGVSGLEVAFRSVLINVLTTYPEAAKDSNLERWFSVILRSLGASHVGGCADLISAACRALDANRVALRQRLEHSLKAVDYWVFPQNLWSSKDRLWGSGSLHSLPEWVRTELQTFDDQWRANNGKRDLMWDMERSTATIRYRSGSEVVEAVVSGLGFLILVNSGRNYATTAKDISAKLEMESSWLEKRILREVLGPLRKFFQASEMRLVEVLPKPLTPREFVGRQSGVDLLSELWEEVKQELPEFMGMALNYAELETAVRGFVVSKLKRGKFAGLEDILSAACERYSVPRGRVKVIIDKLAASSYLRNEGGRLEYMV